MLLSQRYFFLLEFTARNDAGVAIVIADTDENARECLTRSGRYNGTPDDYLITRTLNTGKFGGAAYGLQLETYTNASVVYEAIAALFSTVSVAGYPYIGENQNWWVWSTQLAEYIDSGVRAQGPIGETGPSGRDGERSPYAESDHDMAEHDHMNAVAATSAAQDAATLANNKASLAAQRADEANEKAIEAGRVNATISGTTLTVTDRNGNSTSVDTKGDPGTTDYNDLDNKPNLSEFITKSVDDLVNYYLKSETYTKAEVQALIAAISHFHYEMYPSISSVTSPAGNVLYLIGPTGTGSDRYEEYVYPDAVTGWVKIGDTSIDLSGYVTTSALNTALADYTTTADLTTLLNGKYAKPIGGIPSTDMTEAVQTSLGKADSAVQPARVQAIEEKIPAQASSQNQLADKEFVNSSIATATATFRGTYNLVSDLSLTVSATQEQIAAAIATKLAALSIIADNEDYVFVQIPTADATPTEISRVDRYKYNGTVWAYEWSLNNSSFTAAQWAAINSNITAAAVTKLSNLPDKPVDTASQTLSAAEQLQARTNIGATAPEVFWATYGTTTLAEITAAYNAGKICMVNRNNITYELTVIGSTYAIFNSVNGNYVYKLTCDTEGWSALNYSNELVNNKVSSWSSSPNDNHYPSEKLVKDSLQGIAAGTSLILLDIEYPREDTFESLIDIEF